MRIVIAGGGLAGAAAAAELAQAGLAVTLYEREAGPVDKICGEFLSTEAQASLKRIGFDVAGLGGHPINRLLLARGASEVETALPFEGLGITRKRLDEALLVHAQNCGATIIRGQAVTKIDNRDGAFEAAGAVIKPAHLLLATGKHELRGLKRIAPVPWELVGFKMYFQLTPPQQAALAHKIALILFADGYAGLQLVENGTANLCLLIGRARLKRLDGKWPALLAQLCGQSPYLAGVLAGATELLPQPLTIARVPYGFIHRPKEGDSEHILRLGDQAGVIPSFTGDGMAIALHSAALAASCAQANTGASAYHRRLARDISGQIWRAGFLYRLASAPRLQPAIFRLMQIFPATLRIAARFTRVPAASRLT
jgi:flavin-dependent dehydrogenase